MGGTLGSRFIGALLVGLWACSACGEAAAPGALPVEDAAAADGGREAPDAGAEPHEDAGEADAAAEDAGAEGDAGATSPVDGGVPMEPVDCAARFAGRAGVQLCEAGPDGCGVVFTNGAGCVAVCAAAGLTCGEVWEDVDGACAADRARPQLACTPESGHRSDYCLCVRPEACTPSCDGRSCGDDGCGGSCGACGMGESCAGGQCVPRNQPCTSARCPSFPGAEGFGSRASGGRGGDVYRVTSLSDSGNGTLRHALTSATGPRTIVFAVGGIIRLNSTLRVDQNDLTIAGETAPGDGILIRGGTFRITGRNIIVRHLRFRLGLSGEADAVWVNDAREVILDHCSVSWGSDESLSATRAFNHLTIQDSIIAEDLRSDHQYGSLVNCETEGCGMSLLRNAYINQAGRTPRAASQNGRNFTLEMINNVVYNWGTRGDWGTWAAIGSQERASWNMVGNFYIAGPSTRAISLIDHASTILSCGSGTSLIYLEGNRVDPNRNGALDAVAATWANVRGGCTQVSAPHTVPDWARATLLTADGALAQVIANAGALPWQRDAVDTRLIADLESWGSAGSIKTSVPGWPTLSGGSARADADADGLPDWWEMRHGLNPNDARDRNRDRDGDGYTNLEEYLHYMATPPQARPF